ncbi:extracellular solute-binding protein [Thalassospiraceae bacterium LMO-JJ14]|nr:extracellular solute-binding protein [Thalassospiraceae bacterium LMO-JJ14]
MHSKSATPLLRFVTLAIVLLLASPLSAEEPQPQHGLAMHGDLKYGPAFTHFDYVNPNAPKGGEIRLGAIGGFDSLNPFIIKGNAAGGASFVYDTLLTSSADEAFSEYGQLAKTVRTPEDRSWVEFTLRDEARWHDGKPITADDVIFSFNILVEKGAPFYRFYYGSVARAVKLGPKTVRFEFKPGENRELPLILGQLPVLPKHYWETREFDSTTLEPPLGSGAYRVKSVEANRNIVLERVKDYWGQNLPVNVGQNNFDIIEFEYYRDAQVAIEAFTGGRFDFRQENSSKAWATAYDVPAVKKGQIKLEKFDHDRSSGMQGFGFNLRRDTFKDPKVREALAYAFDFEWSNKNLFYGQYTRTRSYFDNSELAATGLPSDAELKLLEPYRAQLPAEVFTKEYNPPKTDGSGNIRGNLRTASKLLRDAGWVIKDGVRVNEKTGKTLEFEVLLSSPLFERVVLPFAKNLEKLGVKARARTVETAQYRRRIDTFDYDMIVMNWGQSLSPGNEQRDFWGSASADQEGSRNSTGIKSLVIDALVEKLISAPDRQALITACHALDRVLQWQHLVIPHFHAGYDRIAYWDKFGQPKITPTRGTQFLSWWVDSKKAQALNAVRKGSN